MANEMTQQEMEAAYYGAQQPGQDTYTYEERIKLRRMLDAMDQQEAGGMKQFDLAKPPVPAYQFREYPFLMYDHSTGKTTSAQNHQHRQALIAQGWSESPVPIEQPPVELEPQQQAEAELADRMLKTKRTPK
jgi:hypothetical protein